MKEDAAFKYLTETEQFVLLGMNLLDKKIRILFYLALTDSNCFNCSNLLVGSL